MFWSCGSASGGGDGMAWSRAVHDSRTVEGCETGYVEDKIEKKEGEGGRQDISSGGKPGRGRC